MVEMTEKAARQVRRLKEDEETGPDAFLRVRVKKGGCAGFSYKMDFGTQLQEGDKTFSSQGETIVVDTHKLPASYRYGSGF